MILIFLVAMLGGVSSACFSVEKTSQINSSKQGGKLNITQEQFESLIERIAKADLTNLKTVEQLTGVQWQRKKGSEVDAAGWRDYAAIGLNPDAAFTPLYYEWQLEQVDKGAKSLTITAARLTLRFRDEDHLSYMSLWQKYDTSKELFVPISPRELCSFWIGNTDVYMQHSVESNVSDTEQYVFDVTFTWVKNPQKK
jgi:uncharacterized protein Usg